MIKSQIRRNIMYSATLVGLIAGFVSGCDDDDDGGKCEAVNYSALQSPLLKNMSIQQQNQYLSQSSQTCPSGCTYDSQVGCCWCPDD